MVAQAANAILLSERSSAEVDPIVKPQGRDVVAIHSPAFEPVQPYATLYKSQTGDSSLQFIAIAVFVATAISLKVFDLRECRNRYGRQQER